MTANYGPNSRKLTSREVLRMVEVGILSSDEPVELLDGVLVTMSRQPPVHLFLTSRVRDLLTDAYRDVGFTIDHSTVDAGPYSLPEPDVAVVRGRQDDYLEAERLAGGDDLILVVEIAHTTHRESRAKAPIYASAGVPVMWFVDIPKRRVEVYSGGATSAGDYATVTIVDDGGDLELPEVGGHVAVSDLLPRADR